MKSKFEEVSKWGAKWLGNAPWQLHTVDEKAAYKLVLGYLGFLSKVAGITPAQLVALSPAIDIGCGAGFITREFSRHGVRISGSEYDDATVAFARQMQPALEFKKIDLSDFLEPNEYGFIFSREVYLFTRARDFEQQQRVLSNLITSLRPGGVLLLVASNHNRPDCLDHLRAIEHFRKDPRIARVTNCYLEPVFKHLSGLLFGPLSYRCLTLLLSPFIAVQKIRRKWRPSLLVAFVRA